MLINKLTLSGRRGGGVLNNSPPRPENKGRGGLRTHFAIYKLNILKNGGHIQASPTTPHYQSQQASFTAYCQLISSWLNLSWACPSSAPACFFFCWITKFPFKQDKASDDLKTTWKVIARLNIHTCPLPIPQMSILIINTEWSLRIVFLLQK